MRHFPLLGSVFRTSVYSSVRPDFRQSLTSSGLLSRDNGRDIPTPIAAPPQARPNSLPISQKIPSYKSRISTSKTFNRRSTAAYNTSAPNLTKDSQIFDDIQIPSYQLPEETQKPEPPSDHLQTMLDQFLQNIDQNSLIDKQRVYEAVFSEVIREYATECSSQGRLLDRCRLYFSNLTKYVPKIKAKFEDQLKSNSEYIKSAIEEEDELKQKLVSCDEKNNHLQSMVSDLRNDYSTLSGHLEGLSKSITETTKETEEMQKISQQLNSRIKAKNLKLMKLNEELRTLDEVSSKHTADTVTIADYIRNAITQAEQKATELSTNKILLENLKNSLTRLNEEIEDLESKIEKDRLIITTEEEGIQVDLMTAKRSMALEETRRARRLQTAAAANPLMLLFSKDIRELRANFPLDGIFIQNFNEFSELKEYLLRNSDYFKLSDKDWQAAESGDFPINKSPFEFCRLFSIKVVSDAFSDALRSPTLYEISTQTVNMKSDANLDSQLNKTERGDDNRFSNLIPVDYSHRDPQTQGWLLKNIAMIYDEKHQVDIQDLEERKPLKGFNTFLIELAKKQKSLEFLAYQFCWDVNNTTQAFKEVNTEISIFAAALYGDIPTEQLAFMLICRDDIQKAGVPVMIPTEDQSELVSEYFFSQDQLEPYFQKWFKHRYQQTMFQHAMTFAVSPPASHLEATKRYVSMTNIMNTCASEYYNDSLLQMKELLLRTRIVPHIDIGQFSDFLRRMIPGLKNEEGEELYRATVFKSLEREEIGPEEFVSLFNGMSLLYARTDGPRESEECEVLLRTIVDCWKEQKGRVQAIVSHFEQELQIGTGSAQSIVSDCSRFLSLLEHSISIRNAREACQNYFRLLFSIDILYSMLMPIDKGYFESSIVSLECSIKEYWLDSMIEKEGSRPATNAKN